MWVLLLLFCCMNSLYFSCSLNIGSSASWENLKDHPHNCAQTWQYFSPFYTKGMVSSHRVCWKNSRLIWRRVLVLSLRNTSLHITRGWDLFGSTLCIINRNPKHIEFHSFKCQDKEECWSDPKHGPAFLFAVRSTHINILVSLRNLPEGSMSCVLLASLEPHVSKAQVCLLSTRRYSYDKAALYVDSASCSPQLLWSTNSYKAFLALTFT